mgnify:CR=1 FL=1
MLEPYKVNNTGDVIEEILYGKTQSIRDRIAKLQKMIDERHQINQKVINELGDEIAKAMTLAMRGCPTTLEEHITDGKFEREALRLEQVKIIQQVELWRDISALRKEIIELEEKLSELDRQNKLLGE